MRRRVPIVLQLNAVECGAACLAMILGYHGRRVRVTDCRDICGVGRDGTTAQILARAARSFEFRVRAFSVEPKDLEHLTLPAIAHWQFNHFVVVERWTPRRVDIVDPASGRRRLSPAEFEAGLTGVVLTFEPGIHFERVRDRTRPPWRNYAASMLRAPGAASLLAQVFGASLCLLILGLALPLFTKVIVDRVLPLRNVDLMGILAAGLALAVAAQTVAACLRSALLLSLRSRLDTQMMLGFFEHLLSLPFRFFQQRNSGDLLMRLSSNTMIREALTTQGLSAILDGGLVIGYLAILAARDALFCALACGTGCLQIALLLGTARLRADLNQRELGAQSESQSYLVEALSGVAALKASGAEDHSLEHWSSLFAAELNAALRRGQLSVVVDSITTMLRALSPLLLLWVGTFEVLRGSMSLGTMLALIALAAAFLEPLSSLVANGQRMQLAAAHLDRISDVLNAEPEQNPRLVEAAPRLRGHIEFRNVSFRYDPNALFVLRNVSFSIEPGQKTALVGRTGSGKSTLAMLLLGLYEPTEGDILVDGVSLRTLDYRAVRSQFGVVLQEPFLFSGSLRQNIAFGQPDLEFDAVVKAAQMAEIGGEIEQMPMAYETRIAEGGTGLSGGQRQRVSLARALARKPSVLLMDEATSHLDVVTEARVERNLSRLDCTRMVIAHRLSTVCDSGQILVLEDGVVAERGTHEELIARDGCYAALVSGQIELASALGKSDPLCCAEDSGSVVASAEGLHLA